MRTRTQPSTLLSALAHVLDAALHDDPLDVLVLLQEEPHEPGQIVLAIRPLADHPCEDLAGFVAPAVCWGIALVLHGRAHLLDAPDEPPAPVVTTFLRHRDGRQVSLLRAGSRVTEQRGPVTGRVPDLCERILEAPRSVERTGP